MTPEEIMLWIKNNVEGSGKYGDMGYTILSSSIAQLLIDFQHELNTQTKSVNKLVKSP